MSPVSWISYETRGLVKNINILLATLNMTYSSREYRAEFVAFGLSVNGVEVAYCCVN